MVEQAQLPWSPGAGVILEEADCERFPSSAGGRWLDPDSLPEKRRTSFRWIRNLLKQPRDRLIRTLESFEQG